METISLKEELHQYVDQGDKKLLQIMRAIARAYFEEDDMLKASIDRGIRQSISGNVQPNQQVMDEIRSKYKA